MVSKQSTKDLTLRGWSLLNVVLLVLFDSREAACLGCLMWVFARDKCLLIRCNYFKLVLAERRLQLLGNSTIISRK